MVQRVGKAKDKKKWLDKKSGEVWLNMKRTSRRGNSRAIAAIKSLDYESVVNSDHIAEIDKSYAEFYDIDLLEVTELEIDMKTIKANDSIIRRLNKTREACFWGRD